MDLADVYSEGKRQKLIKFLKIATKIAGLNAP